MPAPIHSEVHRARILRRFGGPLLIGIFTIMGFVFSRSLRTGLAMLMTLAIIPVVVRGYIAYLGMPLDFITASAANLDLGMGVDAMIYLTMFAKRDNKNLSSWEPWSKACSHLWRPIGTNFLAESLWPCGVSCRQNAKSLAYTSSDCSRAHLNIPRVPLISGNRGYEGAVGEGHVIDAKLIASNCFH